MRGKTVAQASACEGSAGLLPRSPALTGIAILLCIALAVAAAQMHSPLEAGIFEQLNRLRTNPATYIPVLRQTRQHYHGNVVEIPGRPDLITSEGVRPVDEAIRFLESNHSPDTGLTFSDGLSRAAAGHVSDSGRRGLVGHAGSDGSSFSARLSRYGTWSGEIGEEISYGPSTAQDVISSLLIDDGVADRGHRKSLLAPAWRYVGIACGPHSVYDVMCVIDFAVDYHDR